jgi:hypothetical protein
MAYKANNLRKSWQCGIFDILNKHCHLNVQISVLGRLWIEHIPTTCIKMQAHKYT